jgi:hypothetical protein
MFILGLGSACRIGSGGNGSGFDKVPAPTVVPTATPITKVALGMKFVDFSAFCKPKGYDYPIDGDHLSKSESSVGVTTYWTLARTDFRAKRGCIGTFIFEDWKLNSIYE